MSVSKWNVRNPVFWPGLGVLAVVAALMTGCASRPTQEATPEKPGLIITGLSNPEATERAARESARAHALRKFLRRMGTRISAYAVHVTRESGKGVGQIEHASESALRERALSAFVRRTKVVDADVQTLENGQSYKARVRLRIPQAEVASVRRFVASLREWREAPVMAEYRRIREAMERTRQAHRAGHFARAWQQLSEADRRWAKLKEEPQWRQALPAVLARWSPPPPIDALGQRLLQDLELQAADPWQCTTGGSAKPVLKVRVRANGSAVRGQELALTLPSGGRRTTRTDAAGLARFRIPTPTQPGTYSLAVQPVVPDRLSSELAPSSRPFSLEVTGQRSGLARGRFHAFVESKAVGKAQAGEPGARERAATAARIRARADVAERLQAPQIRGRDKVQGGRVTESGVEQTVASRVPADATTVTRTITQRGDQIVARLRLRLPLPTANEANSGDRDAQ